MVDLATQARRLHDVGLNLYESNAYLVLIGHVQFKALDVASRANIPRAKIYEVLSSLVDKGFVRVVQAKTKQYSAVEPRLALAGYLGRRREAFLSEWEDRQRLAKTLSDELAGIFRAGSNGNSALNYLRIITDTRQIVEEYRGMLVQTDREYVEFARRPYGVDPSREPIVRSLADRGTVCKLLFDLRDLEHGSGGEDLANLRAAGAEVRLGRSVPLKLALFDNHSGMISLDDPVVSHRKITALVFEHLSLGTAMRTLFDDLWNRSSPLEDFVAAGRRG